MAGVIAWLVAGWVNFIAPLIFTYPIAVGVIVFVGMISIVYIIKKSREVIKWLT